MNELFYGYDTYPKPHQLRVRVVNIETVEVLIDFEFIYIIYIHILYLFYRSVSFIGCHL